MANKSPQTFQKLQRERAKQLKRQEKRERRMDRNDLKRLRQNEDGTPVEGAEAGATQPGDARADGARNDAVRDARGAPSDRPEPS